MKGQRQRAYFETSYLMSNYTNIMEIVAIFIWSGQRRIEGV